MSYLEPDPPSQPYWHVRRGLRIAVVVLVLGLGLTALAIFYERGFWSRRALYWVSPADRPNAIVRLCDIQPSFEGPELDHALASETPRLRAIAAWIVLTRGDIRALDAFVELYARLGRAHIKLDPGSAIAEAFQGTVAVPEPDEVEEWWRERRAGVRYVGDGHWRMR